MIETMGIIMYLYKALFWFTLLLTIALSVVSEIPLSCVGLIGDEVGGYNGGNAGIEVEMVGSRVFGLLIDVGVFGEVEGIDEGKYDGTRDGDDDGFIECGDSVGE